MTEGCQLDELSASELAGLVARRDISAREIVSGCLDRLAEVNPAINAVCAVNPRASDEADRLDQRLRRGEAPRRLEGVPFVIKDNISTAGLRTTFGSSIYANNVPAEDAVCVERMRSAGGILLGKTNTSEFATDVLTTNKLFGPTRNPHQLAATSGGSSGGTAAAVAAGIAPVGLGTDFGGSVRIPASYCGIFGLRPVPGRVPVYPTDYGWDTLVEHVVGPLSRTVEDSALVLDVISGPDDRDPSSLPSPEHDFVLAVSREASIKGRRFAYSCDLGGQFPVDPEVERLTRRAANQFAVLGGVVEEQSPDASDMREIIGGTRAFSVIARYADLFDSHGAEMTDQLVRQVQEALKADVRTVARAERARTAYWHNMRKLFENFDFLLTPTVGAPPFRLDCALPTEVGGRPVARYYDVFLATYAFSLVGLPAASVPCGFTDSGLPIGLQIVGRRLREDLVLEAAAAYQNSCPEHFVRPQIPRGALEATVQVEAQDMIFK